MPTGSHERDVVDIVRGHSAVCAMVSYLSNRWVGLWNNPNARTMHTPSALRTVLPPRVERCGAHTSLGVYNPMMPQKPANHLFKVGTRTKLPTPTVPRLARVALKNEHTKQCMQCKHNLHMDVCPQRKQQTRKMLPCPPLANSRFSARRSPGWGGGGGDGRQVTVSRGGDCKGGGGV